MEIYFDGVDLIKWRRERFMSSLPLLKPSGGGSGVWNHLIGNMLVILSSYSDDSSLMWTPETIALLEELLIHG